MGGSFLFRDEQNRRVEAHYRDSIFFLFRYIDTENFVDIRLPSKVNCDVWIIQISREFRDVLFCSIHLFTYLIFCLGKTILLDTLENLILLHGCGESWMRFVRDLHREKEKQHTTEEMMMENFLYGSSDGKLGPIALDFYYALQWMTLLSECGCSSWGAYCPPWPRKIEKIERERAREKACREGKSVAPFLCFVLTGTRHSEL